ncbi:hypothetical protein [Rhizobium leguminosarum]|uniref:hypothetical protein n=1 Tax=Rhizobium leguminosarum TaxID=384 RepID=UPI0021BBECD1|nr:hypothetical protein [Rhizobium leguminosarum]
MPDLVDKRNILSLAATRLGFALGLLAVALVFSSSSFRGITQVESRPMASRVRVAKA